MAIISTALAICFIVCHGGPADHFATFAQVLNEQGYAVHIYACGPALKRLEERGIQGVTPFSLEGLSFEEKEQLAAQIAQQISQLCAQGGTVFTDLGHPFDSQLQQALAIHAPQALRYAYYDNPEAYVPGGYSLTAADVMLAADKVAFANSHLACQPLYRVPGEEIPLDCRRRVAIGYYLIERAQQLVERRSKEHPKMRSDLLALAEGTSEVVVYFGANNEEYFDRAFPAFLDLLSASSADLSHLLIVIQQHPGARAENRDGQMVQAWTAQQRENYRAPTLIISPFTQEQAQLGADAIAYFQTSLAPQLALMNLPLFQIGDTAYPDLLVSNGWALSVTSTQELIACFDVQGPWPTVSVESLSYALGVEPDWQERLLQLVSASRSE
jgi:hypothetical protein